MRNKLNGYIYIYPECKTNWRSNLKNKLTQKNSQRVKYFSWHVSTLFKDLCFVVSIQTNHRYTSLNSIEVIFFPIRFFPHWAHDSSFVGASVVGPLYSPRRTVFKRGSCHSRKTISRCRLSKVRSFKFLSGIPERVRHSWMTRPSLEHSPSQGHRKLESICIRQFSCTLP